MGMAACFETWLSLARTVALGRDATRNWVDGFVMGPAAPCPGDWVSRSALGRDLLLPENTTLTTCGDSVRVCVETAALEVESAPLSTECDKP
jgi:hypothetical protein